MSAAAVGGLVLSACAGSKPAPHQPGGTGAQEQEVPVTPPEDLMREHGVLKRVLLVYREGIGRLQAGDQGSAPALNAAAGIIRSFIEDYHEGLEEQYVFPTLEKVGKLADITAVLRTQHQRGRALTDRILSATGASALNRRALQDSVQDMMAFVRMYEPHEAREDTVVFPALRAVVAAPELWAMAETFEEEEHRRFGARGFDDVVDQVADIEKTLGIYDLAQFTPT
ncbi:hemerythrin domain-containing protein [Mycobacterium basiliense]|nr:hemerythrin domain-containing protein [Mycobacterium basiliense]